jgi:hypothetical protein
MPCSICRAHVANFHCFGCANLVCPRCHFTCRGRVCCLRCIRDLFTTTYNSRLPTPLHTTDIYDGIRVYGHNLRLATTEPVVVATNDQQVEFTVMDTPGSHIIVGYERRVIKLVHWQVYPIKKVRVYGWETDSMWNEDYFGWTVEDTHFVLLPTAVMNLLTAWLYRCTEATHENYMNLTAYCTELLREVDMETTKYAQVIRWAPQVCFRSSNWREYLRQSTQSSWGDWWRRHAGRIASISAKLLLFGVAVGTLVKCRNIWMGRNRYYNLGLNHPKFRRPYYGTSPFDQQPFTIDTKLIGVSPASLL